MAILFQVPGPSIITINGTQLGYVERTVRITGVPKHRGISTDYSGDMDADASYMGEEIYISLRLVKWDEAVLKRARQRLAPGLIPAIGSASAGAIGSLMVQQGNTFAFSIVSQYFATGTGYGNSIPGYYIPQAYLADSDERERGVEVMVENLVFRSIATFDGSGGYVLYSPST